MMRAIIIVEIKVTLDLFSKYYKSTVVPKDGEKLRF